MKKRIVKGSWGKNSSVQKEESFLLCLEHYNVTSFKSGCVCKIQVVKTEDDKFCVFVFLFLCICWSGGVGNVRQQSVDMNTNCRKPFLKFWKILLFPFLNFIYLFLKDFIYLSERERERERVHKQGEVLAEGEAGSQLSKELDAGLWTRSP